MTRPPFFADNEVINAFKSIQMREPTPDSHGILSVSEAELLLPLIYWNNGFKIGMMADKTRIY